MENIINGKEIALGISKSCKEQIEINNYKLKLAIISVGNNKETEIYIKRKIKFCNELGIECINLNYDQIQEKDLIDVIKNLNNNEEVSGIMIELPLPKYLNKDEIINSILPEKDVDGLTDINQNTNRIIPCTALAVVKIIEKYKIDIKNKNIVLVGYSKLIGIPLEKYFIKNNNVPIICNSKTTNLEIKLRQADIIITAVGKRNLITSDMIKEDVIIIDVGICKDNNKIYGDVDFDNCKRKCKLITPVPGGVGPITVSMVVENLINLKKYKCKQEGCKIKRNML